MTHASVSLPGDARGRVAARVAETVYRPRKPRLPTPRMRAEGVRLLDALLVALDEEGYVVVEKDKSGE